MRFVDWTLLNLNGALRQRLAENEFEYFDTLWTNLFNICTAKHGGRDSSARIFETLHVTDANCLRWMIRVAIRTFAQKSSRARHEHRLLRVELLYWRADCKEKQESSLINHLVTYIQRRVVNNPKKASHDKRHDEWEREKNKLKSIAKCVQCHTQSVQLKVKKRPRLCSRRFLCFSRYTFELSWNEAYTIKVTLDIKLDSIDLSLQNPLMMFTRRLLRAKSGHGMP